MTDEITENEVLTADVSFTVYGFDDKPIKKALIALIDEEDTKIIGTTTQDGECLFENVPYDTYTVHITKSNYEPYTNDTFVVDTETITDTVYLVHMPTDQSLVEVDVDESYTFCITKQVDPVYGVSTNILEWLQSNMASLVDDYNHPIFGKVNTGFNDNILKTFGKRPVCDVYINQVEYSTDFDRTIPIRVHSIVLFYLKGANNHTYLKGCELHDLVMQEFITNRSFKWLDDVVRDTRVTNSEIRNQNIRGGYGVMGAFELTHDLY